MRMVRRQVSRQCLVAELLRRASDFNNLAVLDARLLSCETSVDGSSASSYRWCSFDKLGTRWRTVITLRVRVSLGISQDVRRQWQITRKLQQRPHDPWPGALRG